MYGAIIAFLIPTVAPKPARSTIHLDTVVITTIPKPVSTTSTQDITAPSGVDSFRLMLLSISILKRLMDLIFMRTVAIIRSIDMIQLVAHGIPYLTLFQLDGVSMILLKNPHGKMQDGWL